MSNNENGRANNARNKYKYVDGLLKADSQTDLTVRKKEASIKQFEMFIEYQDFGIYNKIIGEKFKIDLINRKDKLDQKSSQTTVEFHLGAIQEFLRWLRNEKGYNKKIKDRDIDYLSLTAEEKDSFCSLKTIPNLPTSSDVILQLESIPKDTEIDRRDRAIFTFLLCTGIRAKALISLPIASFDPNILMVDQNPQFGVKTKNRKRIRSKFLNRDNALLDEFLEWYTFLRNDKKFENHLPLFPKNDQEKEGNSALFLNKNISKEFWLSQSSLTAMMKKRTNPDVIGYFSPHLYRHSAILYATEKCVTPSEFKAVSQNFGHRDVLTTLLTYGNLSPRDVMKKMNVVDARNEQKLKAILRNVEKVDINSTTTSSNAFINDMINLLESHGYNVTER